MTVSRVVGCKVSIQHFMLHRYTEPVTTVFHCSCRISVAESIRMQHQTLTLPSQKICFAGLR